MQIQLFKGAFYADLAGNGADFSAFRRTGVLDPDRSGRALHIQGFKTADTCISPETPIRWRTSAVRPSARREEELPSNENSS